MCLFWVDCVIDVFKLRHLSVVTFVVIFGCHSVAVLVLLFWFLFFLFLFIYFPFYKYFFFFLFLYFSLFISPSLLVLSSGSPSFPVLSFVSPYSLYPSLPSSFPRSFSCFLLLSLHSSFLLFIPPSLYPFLLPSASSFLPLSFSSFPLPSFHPRGSPHLSSELLIDHCVLYSSCSSPIHQGFLISFFIFLIILPLLSICIPLSSLAFSFPFI